MSDDALSNEPVELVGSARSLADLAFIETAGPDMCRLTAALMAYQWAIREARPWDVNPKMTVYPSLNHLRDFLDVSGIQRNTRP